MLSLFNVACGHCFYCQHEMESQCDNSNPHFDSGGYFGYTEKFGNHPGGQAEYLKVPFWKFHSICYTRIMRTGR